MNISIIFVAMIRKGLTYLFMALANLIMVGHSIVPHHHHLNQICFDSRHCVDDAVNISGDKPLHHHDDEHDGHSCFLSEFIPIPVNSSGDIGLSADSMRLFCSLTPMDLASEHALKSPVMVLRINYLTDPPNDYSFEFIFCSGLRAPPVA